MRIEHHYTADLSAFGLKHVWNYGIADWDEPLTAHERFVESLLQDVRGYNMDEGTYDACFKSLLRHVPWTEGTTT